MNSVILLMRLTVITTSDFLFRLWYWCDDDSAPSVTFFWTDGTNWPLPSWRSLVSNQGQTTWIFSLMYIMCFSQCEINSVNKEMKKIPYSLCQSSIRHHRDVCQCGWCWHTKCWGKLSSQTISDILLQTTIMLKPVHVCIFYPFIRLW